LRIAGPPFCDEIRRQTERQEELRRQADRQRAEAEELRGRVDP